MLLINPEVLSSSLRNRIRNAAQQLGAVCLTGYEAACTHYLSSTASGADYERAVRSGAIPVTHSWLFQCLAQNTWCDEQAFGCAPVDARTAAVAQADAHVDSPPALKRRRLSVDSELEAAHSPRPMDLVNPELALPGPQTPQHPRVRLLSDDLQATPTNPGASGACTPVPQTPMGGTAMDVDTPMSAGAGARRKRSFAECEDEAELEANQLAAAVADLAGYPAVFASTHEDEADVDAVGEADAMDDRVTPEVLAEAAEDADDSIHQPLEQLVARGQQNVKRKLVVGEMLEKEEHFLDDLKCLIEVFRDPLLRAGVMSPKLIDIVFANVDKLRLFSERIVEAIGALLDNWNDVTTCMDEIFRQDMLEECLGLFRTYITGHETAKVTLEQQMKKHRPLRDFVRACELNQRCKREKLVELIHRPVQHVTRYMLYLRELHKHTPQDHPDRARTTFLIDKFADILSRVNEAQASHERYTVLFNELSDIENYDPTLLRPERSFVAKYELRLFNGRDNARKFLLMLFNDSILLAVRQPKALKNTLRYMQGKHIKQYRQVAVAMLSDINVCDVFMPLPVEGLNCIKVELPFAPNLQCYINSADGNGGSSTSITSATTHGGLNASLASWSAAPSAAPGADANSSTMAAAPSAEPDEPTVAFFVVADEPEKLRLLRQVREACLSSVGRLTEDMMNDQRFAENMGDMPSGFLKRTKSSVSFAPFVESFALEPPPPLQPLGAGEAVAAAAAAGAAVVAPRQQRLSFIEGAMFDESMDTIDEAAEEEIAQAEAAAAAGLPGPSFENMRPASAVGPPTGLNMRRSSFRTPVAAPPPPGDKPWLSETRQRSNSFDRWSEKLRAGLSMRRVKSVINLVKKTPGRLRKRSSSKVLQPMDSNSSLNPADTSTSSLTSMCNAPRSNSFSFASTKTPQPRRVSDATPATPITFKAMRLDERRNTSTVL